MMLRSSCRPVIPVGLIYDRIVHEYMVYDRIVHEYMVYDRIVCSVLGRILRVTDEVMQYRHWIAENFTPPDLDEVDSDGLSDTSDTPAVGDQTIIYHNYPAVPPMIHYHHPYPPHHAYHHHHHNAAAAQAAKPSYAKAVSSSNQPRR